MQVELSVTLLWSLANNLSFWVAALLTNSTLTMRKSKWQTFLGWLPFVILHFAVCAVSYSFNITDDNLNLLSLLVLVPAAAMVLYSDERAARVFTSVMGALIANVTTFFFCGTTLSFIDNTSNPYNMRTIGIFLCIKAFWFAVMFFAYRHFVSHIVQQVISVLGKQLKSYVPIPVYCFIAFAIVNRLTNTLGILPGLPDTRVYFISLSSCIMRSSPPRFGPPARSRPKQSSTLPAISSGICCPTFSRLSRTGANLTSMRPWIPPRKSAATFMTSS